MNSSPMIEAHDLRRRDAESERVILDGVTLQINAGECIGLMGPSGSGKSTLLRAIARLDPMDQGELFFQGNAVRGDDIPPYRRRVVYVSQQSVVVQPTLREDLQHIFQFQSSKQPLDWQQAESQLVQFGKTASMLDQPADQLSGGEKQIAALVRAMTLSPLVLLLDEPTASLDAVATEGIETGVKQWLAGDVSRAVVWVSHDQQQIQRVATRVIQVNAGRVGGS
ncbi:MAG: ABC transporter ATP-binding protein [Rubripirellula sp.]